MNTKSLIVVIILCVAIIFLFLDKCGSSSRLDRLKGQYENALETARAEKEIKEAIIENKEREIESLNGEITSLNEEIEEKEADNAELDEDVRELEQMFDKLDDKDAKIANLTEQVGVWKDKFSLAESIIADKDEIIFSLSEKFEAQLKISLEYKELYEGSMGRIKILEDIKKAQSSQIARIRFTSNFKTGIVLGLAGLVLYNLIK